MIMNLPLPEFSDLIQQRLALLRRLAESLEGSQLALVRNDAEAIARGAAHQAELCRQWSQLEDQLRLQSPLPGRVTSSDSTDSNRIEQEWEALGTRIRYLTRVHWSLLRHLQRSLIVLTRVVESCADTYTPAPGSLRAQANAQVGE